MKKTKLLTISLFALLALTGCNFSEESSSNGNSETSNSTSEATSEVVNSTTSSVVDTSSVSVTLNTSVSPNPNTSNNVVTTSGSVVETKIDYVVKVVDEKGELVKNSKITGQLCDDANCFAFRLGADGTVTKKLEKNDYEIHIFNLPDGYTYNPYLYKASESNNEVVINLIKAKDVGVFIEGSQNPAPGEMYNHYKLKGEGTFLSKNVKNEDVFYGFYPTRPGNYSIESWVEDVDVKVVQYDGSIAFINTVPIGEDDDSGYDKNFKYEFEVSNDRFIGTDEVDEDGNIVLERDENGDLVVGSPIYFCISAKDALVELDAFPITIKFESEYIPPVYSYTDVLPSKELIPFADNEDEEVVLKDASVEGFTWVVFNEEDGYYHVNNENGPLLLVHVTSESQYLDPLNTMEYYSDTFSFPLEEKYSYESYTKFIAAYSQACNSDGVYPVNEEMKTFLTKLMINQDYYGGQGTLTWQINGSVDEDSKWLYACCYYQNMYSKYVFGDGTKESPYLVTQNCMYKVEVPANGMVYFETYGRTEFEKIDLISPNAKAKLSYNGEDFSGENGFNVVAIPNPEELNAVRFALSITDGSEATIVLKVNTHEDIGDRDNIIIGKNVITLGEEDVDGVELTFTAPYEGSYFINPGESAMLWHIDSTNELADPETGIVYDYFGIYNDLMEGETITFYVTTLDILSDECSFEIEYTMPFNPDPGDYENPVNTSFVLGENVKECDADNCPCGYFVALEEGSYKISVNSEGTCWAMIIDGEDYIYLGLKELEPVRYEYIVDLEAEGQIYIVLYNSDDSATSSTLNIVKVEG